jgi:hypothetical protein
MGRRTAFVECRSGRARDRCCAGRGGGAVQEGGQLFEHGRHVHLRGIEQPLQLEAVGGGYHQACCTLRIQGARELAGLLLAVDVRRDVRAEHLVAVDEELPCRTRRVRAFRRHRDVQPHQTRFDGIVLDDLDQAFDGDIVVDSLIVEAGVAFVATTKHFDEELLLGAEVMEEAGLAQTDETSDLAEGGAVVSHSAEQLECDVDDLGTFGFAFRVRSTSCHGDMVGPWWWREWRQTWARFPRPEAPDDQIGNFTPVSASDTSQRRRWTVSSWDRSLDVTTTGCPLISRRPSGP